MIPGEIVGLFIKTYLSFPQNLSGWIRRPSQVLESQKRSLVLQVMLNLHYIPMCSALFLCCPPIKFYPWYFLYLILPDLFINLVILVNAQPSAALGPPVGMLQTTPHRGTEEDRNRCIRATCSRLLIVKYSAINSHSRLSIHVNTTIGSKPL